MKINAIILLVICALSSIALAGSSYGQSVLNKDISIKLKNVPLSDALDQIAANTGVRIMYTGNVIDNSIKITLKAKNEKLADVLKKVLLPNQLIVLEIEGSLLVKAAPTPPAEEKTDAPLAMISGIVVDDKGEPLIGVSVKISGLTTGTTTDTEGKFHLQAASENTVLIFSYIGFETQRVTVGTQTVLRIVMVPTANSLSAVVIVGYGTTTKKELTSAISTVNAADFNAGVVTTPADVLEGKVAGLNITNDGNPNGVATVTLRGPSTLRGGGASSPFYVIDGVPDADYNLISPADIESIEVLKDASAAAIYGTRATNGVIIITTKKAKAGQLQVTYNGYAAMEKIANQFQVASSSQLRSYVKANGKAFSSANDNGGNTNWEQEVERPTGFSQNHNLTFGGGTDQTVFSASLNYLQNEGIIKNSELDRFTGRLNLSQKALNNKLKLDFTLINSISNSDLIINDFPANGANGGNPNLFQDVVEYLPTRTVYTPAGALYNDPTLQLGYNPVGLITNNIFKQKINRLLINGKAELKLPFGILYNLNTAYQDVSTTSNTYYNSASELAPNLNGVATRSYYEDTKKLFENYLSYGHNWNNLHDFKILIGYSFDQTTTGDGFQSSNENFISDATSYNNLALGNPPSGYLVNYGGVQQTTLRLISFYSRINYSFLQKYILQASVRRDGSNAFGSNDRWGYFPAVSGAWRIIDESFMKSQNLFSDLKVRLGYGITGNSLGFNPYTPLTQYGPQGTFFYSTNFGSYYTAIGPTQNPNPNLKWEKTATLNAGIDFALFNGKLSGSVDVYDKKTTNMIYSVPVSTVSNLVGNTIENVGSMTNKGVEISLTGTPVRSTDFSWQSYGNIAFNHNLITSLGTHLSQIFAGDPEGPGQSGINTSIIQSGYPLGEFYTLKYIGVINGVSTYLGANGKPTTSPTSTDQSYAGSAQPTYTFGWGNTFNYKNFSLNFFFRGQGGNKIMDASLANFSTPAQASVHNVPVITLSEPITDYNANLYSTRYIENGAFIRLSNATLAYKIKVSGNYIHALRIYVSGTNLFTITKYKGVDPELNLTLNNQQSGQFVGLDSNNFYPKTRTFLGGFQADF